ncbi:hypothetical protein C444_21346 [Haloarcula japonica DSM 6131]|uniref:Uncharacterized protein n=1 Tax=Haloarcula japonica (strain ATCC 49778 / DSM 6131 / JCM 7785 / NBRC 101032 / NCIMB 13157 / TR-1) TaxID=1227453 RepID=M0L0F4_HALJT|nr:hypothetical protein C444_21346 [Haloarcula japonica DSM 6131]
MKIAIFLAFGLDGLWTIFVDHRAQRFVGGVFSTGLLASIVGTGAIFVSFESFLVTFLRRHRH